VVGQYHAAWQHARLTADTNCCGASRLGGAAGRNALKCWWFPASVGTVTPAPPSPKTFVDLEKPGSQPKQRSADQRHAATTSVARCDVLGPGAKVNKGKNEVSQNA
jgi:hypothetical protein